MKHQKGFTLIEVLIAMAILGIIVAGTMGSLIGSTKAAVKSDQMDTARALALSQLEYVKRLPYSLIGYSPDSSIMSQHPGYTASIAILPAEERDANIQRITASIAYRDIYTGQMVSANLQDFKVH
jgi:prepilin-type N-terminal cleavage/methylation domain-containing protein